MSFDSADCSLLEQKHLQRCQVGMKSRRLGTRQACRLHWLPRGECLLSGHPRQIDHTPCAFQGQTAPASQ